MSDPDEAITRVLNGLGRTDPAPGLQGRILRELEGRAFSKKSGRFSFRWLSGQEARERRIYLAATFGGVVAVGLAVFGGNPHPGVESPSRARVAMDLQASPQANNAQTPQSAASVKTLPVIAGEVGATKPIARKRLNVSMVQRETKPRNRSKSLAEEEAEAPSTVAPPMPLTTSERLLLQMAQGRRPEEIALLTRQLSAEHDAQARQDFRDFFEPAQPQHAD